MREKFGKYEPLLFLTKYKVATTLDPHFKLELFDDEEEAPDIMECLGEYLETLQLKEVSADSSFAPARSLSEAALTRKKRNALSKPTNVSDEVLNYFNEPRHALQVQPLDWWKRHSARWPRLAMAARDFFSVSATSVASEQINSSGRLLISYTR